MMSYIYKITNLINQKMYIGQTSDTIENRWKEHWHNYDKEPKCHRPLYKAFQKYGKENFKIELLEECSLSEVSEKEQYWIKTLHTYIKDPQTQGYNLTKGGEGTILLDYDRIFTLWTQGYNCTEIANLIPCNLGVISPILQTYGITAQEIWQKARILTGKKKSKAVDMLDKDTEEILMSFPSITAAAQYLNKNCGPKISLVCQGKRNMTQGYKWRYSKKNEG